MLEDIIDDNENAVEIATSETQQTEIANQAIQEYIDAIRSQAESCIRKPVEDDYFESFANGFLKIPAEEFYDSAYITDDKLSRNDKDYMTMFLDAMNYTFEMNFGIKLLEPTSGMLYSLYKIFITNFSDFFLNYVCGLQKLDSLYEEDIPNWEELSFENYKKITGVTTPAISYNLVNSYIDHIIENGIIAESYFDICDLESSGNDDLTYLMVETANYRVQYDNEFFRIKLGKILSTNVIRDSIVNKLVDILAPNESDGNVSTASPELLDVDVTEHVD